MKFTYTVVNKSHELEEGIIEAPSAPYAILLLQTQGYIVSELRTATDGDIRLYDLRHRKATIEGRIPIPRNSSKDWILAVVILIVLAAVICSVI